MVTTRSYSWKKTPVDPNLNCFLRVHKQKVFRRPVASLEAPTVELSSTEQSSTVKSTSWNTAPLSTKAFGVQTTSEVDIMSADQLASVEKLTSKRIFLEKMIRYPTQLEQGLKINPEVTGRRVQYDFLLEGLFVEWRTRRQKFLAPDPEDKAPGQSFFPHQHDQPKYWAWPFLGIVALTSSLPLVRSVKKPLSSTFQPFQIEIEAESNGFSTAQAFDTLSYNPNELTSKSNELFEQTLRLGLSPTEVAVPSNGAFMKGLTTTVEHPMSNFDYSKMILDALIKKTYCHSAKSKPGYVSNVLFTTSESENYLPTDPVDDNDVHEFSGSLDYVKLKDLVYSRSFVLPFMTAKENWGHPVNPVLYRQWEKGLVYRYINQWLSTEADEMRRYRDSFEFASRHVEDKLRLEASFKELSLLKQFATPMTLQKIKNKWKTTAKPWKASMDSTQWLKSLVLNAESVSTRLLSNKQQEFVKEVPTNVTLLAQDWPTLPKQFNRISKSSHTYPEIDNTSFLKPLADPQQAFHTAIEVAKVIGIPEVLHDRFLPSPGVRTLGDRLANWLVNWSFTYSTKDKDGIINDATFTNQFGKETGREYAQTVKWNRPQISQNPNYEALSTTNAVNKGGLPEQLFRAYVKYESGKKVLTTISSDLTRTLERTQDPLHFDYELTSGKKGSKFLNDDSPTPGAVLKTFVFRSPSAVDDTIEAQILDLKRRRAGRYRRAGLTKKKRRRIHPRPNWLQEGLSNPLLKRRHPSVKDGNNNTRFTIQRSGQVHSALNLQNKLTPKRANAEIPSLFRQKGLNHSLMTNLPQLMDRNLFHLAKWAEPKSTLKSWRQLMFGDEYKPYKNAVNRNFKHLQETSFGHPLTSKLVQMPQWFWKGSRSEADIEGLRFKQLPSVNHFGSFVDFNSDATTSRFLLNELHSVALQNALIYQRLNTMVSLHRDKMGFMRDKRPNFSNVNRVRLGFSKALVWPEAWSNVAFTPSNQTQSQWILKQSHLLRDPDLTDIQRLWRTGKLRTLNKAVRESTQKSIFRLRLPFVSRTQVQPVTVERSWKKVNVMDTKLKVFGLLNHRTDLYPRQLKSRFQKKKGALNTQNVLLTPQELEMQQSINYSVQFWWDETQHKLLPLVNPLGAQPWSMFNAAMAPQQLTSESQSLTINLVNSSLVLLHIALLSFLIQLPETRTFLKFYVLVFSRVAKGYVWMTTMCYSLLLECVYEIKFACQCGYLLMFPWYREMPFTEHMVLMHLERNKDNSPSSEAFTWTRFGFGNGFADEVPSAVVDRLLYKDALAVELIETCLYRHDVLTKEEHEKYQASHGYQEYRASKLKKFGKQHLSPKHFTSHNAGQNGSGPPSNDPSDNGSGLPSPDLSHIGSDGDGTGIRVPKPGLEGVEPKYDPPQDRSGARLQNVSQNGTKQTPEKQRTLGAPSDYYSYKRPNLTEYSTEYLGYAEFLFNQCLETDTGFKNIQTRVRQLENLAEKGYEVWWGYNVFDPETRVDIFRSMFPSMSTDDDELANRLVDAEQNWSAWEYEVAYMKERQNLYNARLALEPVSVGPFYQHTLKQGVLVRDILVSKLSKVFTKWGRRVAGLSFAISRKSYELYNNVDTALITAREVTLKFMEEPAENTMTVFNEYFFTYFMADILSHRIDEVETWNTVMVEGYTRQLNAFGPLGSLVQRRLHRVFDDFYIAFTRPDMDLLLRHQKSLIFWDMWGALLIRAVARYELSLADFMSTKEEQEKLLECLITESDWSWTQQSLIQFQPLFDLLNVGNRNWKAFTVPSAAQYVGDPPPLQAVFESHIEVIPPKELKNLEAFESLNPADLLYANNHAISFDDLSQHWGAQQTKMYHSRLSTLGVEYHPAWGLKAVPQVTQYVGIHTQLGGIIKDNLLTTFTQTPSKNALIVGPPGPEVTSLVRALVGELELKFICDSARRYTTVIKNVAIGVRHLKEVFYSISVEAPCLFVLEDIHLVGQRRELLIAEDEELYLLERNQVTDVTDPHEQDYIVDKFEGHSLLLYEKPYRGDYSFLIATNCFAYDYFSEPPTSRLRHAGRFTESHYKLPAIEHELVKLRGLENLSNAQAYSPGLTVTSEMEARKPIKEVKAAPNSPLTVAIEKNKKAFRPRRIVKNMPLEGISWDMWMLLSRYDYSIRSKVALLAVLTEDALGEITDTITDLLVMMDTVRATRGLVMFATTHSPTSLDPALRRPGRLDETLQLPLYSSVMTRWQLLKLRLKAVDRLQELAPYATLTRNLANYEVLEFALKTTLSLLPRKVSFQNRTKPPEVKPINALKAKIQISYFTAFFQSKGFNALKEQLDGIIDVPSERHMLDTQARQRKFQSQVSTLTYSLVGAHLIRWKAKVITDEMDTDFLTYSVDKVHPLLTRLEFAKNKGDFALARMRDPVLLREHYTNSLASRFAETFFTSALVNAACPSSLDKQLGSLQFTFQLREKNNYVPLTFEKFELAASRFKPGESTAIATTLPAFRNNLVNVGVPATRMSYFVSAIAQKRLVWAKNTIVHRLLYLPMKQAYAEALGLPVYDITDRDKQFETLQKEQRVLYTPGNLTMNEKIELHKTYRLYLAVANRTVEDWHASYKPEELQLLKRHVLPSLEELSSLAFVMNHPTGTTKYYRQSMHLRQRFHLIDEWWNGHLEDFDVETALGRDVETRTFFVEAIGNDVEIDYPQPDKYYNVRSRRWVSKGGNETWFLKEAKYNDTIAYHYMVCALTRCYGQLHTHRESLDHLAYTFLKEGSLSEVETFSHYTRFYHS
uniref:Cell division protein n=1 Tax=Mychonastes jurisii TaxID=797708 RepID=A0A0S2LMU4_MYCJU|nr:cell division protein [Mychonastes jurisii]ALO62702.1 cell division protein [Mychonastes jurisii]